MRKRGSGYRWVEARMAGDRVEDYAERSLTVAA